MLVAFTSPAGAALTPSVIAGYTASIGASHATATTKLTVPTLTCPALGPFQAIGAGPLLSTAAGNSFAGLTLICSNGTAFYSSEFEVNGAANFLSDPVAPGDVMKNTVSESPTATMWTLADLTQGWTHSGSGPGSAPISAAVGAFSGNCTSHSPPCSPVPQFTVLHFNGAKVNAQSLSSANARKSNIVSSTGLLEVSASALNSSGTALHAKLESLVHPRQKCSVVPTLVWT